MGSLGRRTIASPLSRLRLAAIICCVTPVAATPAAAAEECLAQSIDKAGQCHKRGFVKRFVDDQLRGIEPAKGVAPDSIDPDILATQLTGHFAKGAWYPVMGLRNAWMLIVTDASVGIAPAYTFQSRYDEAPSLIALVKVTPLKAKSSDDKPIVTVIARSDNLVAGTEAEKVETGQSKRDTDIVPCANPDPEDSGAGGYPQVGGQFRWVTLSPKHPVLAATVSRSEGYAGGGGSFTGEILLEIRRARLVPVACYAVSRYQMFGGEWNPDGTRQHPESQAAWDIRKTGKQVWPTLRLQAMTRSTPSATLIWDAKYGHYRER